MELCLGRMTGAFTWPSLHDIRYKYQLNLWLHGEPLLPALDMFGLGWVIKRPSHGSRNVAEDDTRPNILHLNTEGLTANKISVNE